MSPDPTNYSICGVLVMAPPTQCPVIEGALNDIAGVEVHGRSDEGKLVVTVEDTPERRCIDTVTSLMDVKGVLSTTIVYQHTETDDEDSSAESVQ